uniref:Lymphocyte activation gene 3 protein n=1 Tax=Jaculus jaculus TaxID=51337 RepID=A0A8C5K2Z4_JACJA
MRAALFLDLLLQLLWKAPVEAPGPGTEIPMVVWAQEGAAAQLPCSPTTPLQDPSLLRRAGVTWQHQPDSDPQASSPARGLRRGVPSPPGPAPQRYTVLNVAPGGLRSGKLPLLPRVQLAERGLQRTHPRPAHRMDLGTSPPPPAQARSTERGDRPLTAVPSGSLMPLAWVILNCSFSRPDRPASVHWFRGPSRLPVLKSPRCHFAETFLFLPKVSPLDSGTWGCVLTYGDGFNVSVMYNLTVLGLQPLSPLTVYAGAGSRVELPCYLPPGGGAQSPLVAKWTPPGRGPDIMVAGDSGNFSLQLEAVNLSQAGTYVCSVHLQERQLQATVTLAVITVTPKYFGLPGSLGELLCEVTPASGQEHFVWYPLDKGSWRSCPGPWLEIQETRLLSQPWQCQLYQGKQLLGAVVHTIGSSPGARHAGRIPGSLKGGQNSLFLILGVFSLLLLVTGVFGFHLRRRQWLPKRFSALEHGIHPPRGQSKIEVLEREVEIEPEEPEPTRL